MEKFSQKKIKLTSVIALFGAFSTIALIVYLLVEGKIGTDSFTTLFITIIIASLALYGFDRLKELDIKNARLILQEVKQARADVYAKAETVKRIGEELADLTSFSVTRVGRFAGDDLEEKMLEARDKIAGILKEIGSDETKIAAVSNQIEDMILNDLKNDAGQAIWQEIIKNRKDPAIRQREFEKFQKLMKDYRRQHIIDALQKQGLAIEPISPLLDKIDKFIVTKKL